MATPEDPSIRDLKYLFCERYKCPPSEFDKRALGKCLYFHARVLAPLIRLFHPENFERDNVFIDYFGKAKTMRDVMAEGDALHYQDGTKPRFARSVLRLRISSRKARKLAGKLFWP